MGTQLGHTTWVQLVYTTWVHNLGTTWVHRTDQLNSNRAGVPPFPGTKRFPADLPRIRWLKHRLPLQVSNTLCEAPRPLQEHAPPSLPGGPTEELCSQLCRPGGCKKNRLEISGYRGGAGHDTAAPQGFGFMVSSFGFRVSVFGARVQGLGLRVQGGLRVHWQPLKGSRLGSPDGG